MRQNAPGKKPPVILEGDLFELTPAGRKELGGAGTSLSRQELEALVLIDGKSTVGEILSRAETVGVESFLLALGSLFQSGLIQSLKPPVGGAQDFIDFFSVTGPLAPEKARLAKAQKAAAETATFLRQRGYSVSIARRPAVKRPHAGTGTPSILVVEDEVVLAKVLKQVLEKEGFDVRNAMNGREIVDQIRGNPVPDLVLLDVMLPDVDGFQVLARFRQHPALKNLPVVMLTSSATREAVLKGLIGGANGYITKPFELPVLIKAVHAVLGMSEEGVAETPGDPWSHLP